MKVALRNKKTRPVDTTQPFISKLRGGETSAAPGINALCAYSNTVSPTLTTKGDFTAVVIPDEEDPVVRMLTEREFFRLMGVSEGDIDSIMSAGLPKSALYILAGNSIVVDCLDAIFTNMFVNTTDASEAPGIPYRREEPLY